jgi:polysaccharide deacetylase family protein (PEP-CTERM system associated)
MSTFVPPLVAHGTAEAAGPGVVPRARAASYLALSIDVEEYFHGEVFAGTVRPEEWVNLPRRAAPFVERIGQLLEQYESKATFFVLGWTVPYLAPLLRHLASQGHEIACHGDGHQHLRRLTPNEFRDDVRAARARLEDAVGVRPRGYRAPTFSITRETAWALDVLAEEGFAYDASIFPIHHDRYGVPAAPTAPFRAVGPGGGRLPEFPPLTLSAGPLRLPLGGGGYLRLLPASAIAAGLAWRQRRCEPALLYLHPWELDPDQPRLPLRPLAQWRHRVNLGRTEGKLIGLLRRFRFATVWQVLQPLAATDLPEFALAGPGA